MLAGARAAEEVAAQAEEVGTDLSTALAAAADAWCDASGGTSGALWSAGLRAAATSLHDDGARRDPGSAPRLAGRSTGGGAGGGRHRAASATDRPGPAACRPEHRSPRPGRHVAGVVRTCRRPCPGVRASG
jgi:hypothetical protein